MTRPIDSESNSWSVRLKNSRIQRHFPWPQVITVYTFSLSTKFNCLSRFYHSSSCTQESKSCVKAKDLRRSISIPLLSCSTNSLLERAITCNMWDLSCVISNNGDFALTPFHCKWQSQFRKIMCFSFFQIFTWTKTHYAGVGSKMRNVGPLPFVQARLPKTLE